ncbi:MAG: hypothetical protein KIT10_12260 [Flavobacteriales bacterium]|nr:hypothetical protein [Flavobacteriales bacterium]
MRLALAIPLLPLFAAAQPLAPTLLSTLGPAVPESSGLIVVDGALWTHNDSWNEAKLYQVEPATGAVVREVTLTNTSNIDWEAVTHDGEWVYVGDFGNNLGNRTDLRIFRFPLSQLIDPGVTSILVDTIRFAYADQTDFTPANQANNWDLEAFIAKDDSLFLFTKRWLDARTKLYALPAIPGDHLAAPRTILDTQGLVTDASYDPVQGRVVLLGYTNILMPFVWRLSDYSGNGFFQGQAIRHDVALPFTQTEGVAWHAPDSVYISSESGFGGPARLWSLKLDSTVGMRGTAAEAPWRLSPNPASDLVRILGLEHAATVRLYDARGIMLEAITSGPGGAIAVGHLEPGPYQMEVRSQDHQALLRLMIAR